MSHVVIIIQQRILPPEPATTTKSVANFGEMKAEVTFTPADTMTDAQIGNQVERIVKRLTKLADD